MRLSVFGLGCVGCVSAACLAQDGHDVLAVDIDRARALSVAEGRSPLAEAGLEDILAEGVSAGRLRVVQSAREAVRGSEVSLICVETPCEVSGRMNPDRLVRCVGEIGQELRRKAEYHLVSIRSTTMPGTTEGRLIPILEETSGKLAGDSFGVTVNPEFLREGTAVSDFRSPSRVVIGELDERSGNIMSGLYRDVQAPLVRTSIPSAEMIKYADNAFHALKVAFANEIAALCNVHGIDSTELMETFCLDTRLNLSAAYLRPGSAFGGSCLAKDLRALLHHAVEHGLALPLLSSVLPSNEAQKQRTLELILRTGRRRICILGLTFKPGAADLRESSTLDIVQALVKAGCEVRVFDPAVSARRLDSLITTYGEPAARDIRSFLVDSPHDAVEGADLVVVTHRDKRLKETIGRLAPSQMVIDLWNMMAGSDG